LRGSDARLSGDPGGNAGEPMGAPQLSAGRARLWLRRDDMPKPVNASAAHRAWPLAHKALALSHLGDSDRARAVWRELVDR
jgi:hypothetical protein